MVSQDHDLFAASLLENILYGDKDFLEPGRGFGHAGHGRVHGDGYGHVGTTSDQRMKGPINSEYENFEDFDAPSLMSVEDLVAERFELVNAVLTALASGDPLPGDSAQVRFSFSLKSYFFFFP